MAVITPSPAAHRDRLSAALDRIGHQSSIEFRDRLAAAFDQVRAPSPSAAVNIAVGELALALEPDDPRGSGLRMIQGGLDQLYSVELERERLVA